MTKTEFIEFMGEVLSDIPEMDRKKCADKWWSNILYCNYLHGKTKVIKSSDFNEMCTNNNIQMYCFILFMSYSVIEK